MSQASTLGSNLNRYEKYDAPMGKRRETKGDDPYQEEYDLIMSQVEDLNRVSCM
jgi:hypothetical protein